MKITSKIVVIIGFLFIPYIASINDQSFGNSQSIFNKQKSQLFLANPNCVTLEQENQEYIQNYKQHKYDIEQSTQFTLSNLRKNQSMVILGQAGSNLHIEITIANQHARDSKLPIKNNLIYVYILGQNTKQIISSACIYQHRLISLQKLQSKLYQILAVLKEEGTEADGRGSAIISIHTKMEKARKDKINIEWLKQYEKKVDMLYDQNTIIFLEGLEGWGVIEQSLEQYRSHHYKWKVYSIIELAILIVVSVAQLAYLKKLLSPNIVLI